MIYATVTGNLGKDSELFDTKNGAALRFSVASQEGFGDKKTTVWVSCSMFGKRAATLAQYLIKGVKVVAVGRLSQRDHNGKTYLNCDVQELEFSGGRRAQSSDQPAASQAATGGDGYSDADYGATPQDDDFPF